MPKYMKDKVGQKSYEKGKNDRYGNPAKGKTMSHDKSPSGIHAMPSKHDTSRVQHKNHDYKGYDSKAFEYKY